MEYVVFAAALAAFLAFVAIKGIWDEHKTKKRFITWLKENYGTLPERKYKPEEFTACESFFRKHKTEGQIDDITWNDLNLDEVYKSMNYTYSSAGDEYLYYVLRTPCYTLEELQKRERLIAYFREDQEERIRLQVVCSRLGRTGRYSIYDYLDNLDTLGERNNRKHWLINFLFLPAVALCFIRPSYGLLALVLLSVWNMIAYFREKEEIEPYIVSFAYIMKLLKTTDDILAKAVPEYVEEAEILKNTRKEFFHFKRGSFWLMSSGRMSGSGNPLDIILDYFRMVFHIDLMKFNSMLSEVRRHTKDVDRLISVIGYLEVMIAVGAYRERRKDGYCVPELIPGKAVLQAEQIYHPLIEKPVKNSISADRGVLLTGSNASGKSTFLRTVALNAVLAQTVHTCMADRYYGGFFRIFSSMALKDDLYQGESYYIVEIKSIKRILDASVQSSIPVLCFVDEVLRGTNTVERIAAATQILKSLAGGNVLCFAATHDIELTQLLHQEYDNYHFEEEIADKDVHFSYQLFAGKATTRNAIKLLKVMGYQEEIIKKAERMAEQFTENGVWKA